MLRLGLAILLAAYGLAVGSSYTTLIEALAEIEKRLNEETQ